VSLKIEASLGIEGVLVIINTSRFGQVQIEATDIIAFPDGLLGFDSLRQFVILDDPNDEIFAWLQSVSDAQIAFPILEPELFAEGYRFQLAKSDQDKLGLESTDTAKVFCIVTIPNDPTRMTANLKAPILINLKTRVARQCVLQDNGLAIREPIFAKLQARVVRNPDQRLKSFDTAEKPFWVEIKKNRTLDLDTNP
jgi:flagellar assembly factor FliW